MRLPDASSPHARRPTRRDIWVASILGVAFFGLLLFTSSNVGVARDEGIYIDAARQYQRYMAEVEKHPSRRTSKQTIDRYYRVNAEHPPGTKHLYGLSWRYLHECNCHRAAPRARPGKPPHTDTWGVLDELSAMRLPAMAMAGLLVAFIYLLGAITFGRMAGLIGALAYTSLPRVFFHSHLAGLDAPITAAMLVTVYGYYRSLHSWRWSVATGLLFGLALLAKFNALFLPLLLMVHYAWTSRREFRHPLLAAAGLLSALPLLFLSLAALVTGKGRGWAAVGGMALFAILLLRRGSFRHPLRTIKLTVPAVFISMMLLGFSVLYLQWPWLWHDTLHRFGAYLSYHMEHTFYNTEYLGKNYNLPPFPVEYPFVMTLWVMPLPFVLAAVGGLGLCLRGLLLGLPGRRSNPRPGPAPEISTGPEGRPSLDEAHTPGRGWGRPMLGLDRSPELLVALCALFPMVLIALPSTPIFGGARLWMPAWPFLALLAGWAVSETHRLTAHHMGSWLHRAAWAGILGATLVLPSAALTARAGDVAPSVYVAAVGGIPGAADRGLKRQYWGYSTRRLLPELNRMARPRLTHFTARVPTYFHDTNHYSRNIYVRCGLLLPNITYAGDGLPGIRRSQIAIFLYEKHQVMWEFLIWQDYATLKPARVLTLDGVPLITVYRRRQRRAARPPFFMEPRGWRRTVARGARQRRDRASGSPR